MALRQEARRALFCPPRPDVDDERQRLDDLADRDDERRVRVDNELGIPVLEKYLSMTSPDEGVVFGDFEMCPLGPDEPGHQMSVCVTDAKRLVVQPLRDSRPAFRLLSTWPSAKR